MFSTLPGHYYVEYDLYLPSLGYFCYPVRTENFSLQAGNSPLSLPAVSLTRFYLSNVNVSTNSSHPYFKTVGDALKNIQRAVNDPSYVGSQVTLNVLPGNNYWPDNNNGNEYFFNYQNTNNSALTLLIRGSSALDNPTTIEPISNQFQFRVNRTNIQFQYLGFSHVMVQEHYFIYFEEQNDSSYLFTRCTFGNDDPSDSFKSSMIFENTTGITFHECTFKNNDNSSGSGVLKLLDCSNVVISQSTFINNVSMYGAAIHINQIDGLTISNCLFESNRNVDGGGEMSSGTHGSAIYIYDSQNTVITKNRFINNQTTGAGGPIYYSNSSLFSITENTFIDNTAQRVGYVSHPSDSAGFNKCVFSLLTPFSRNVIKSAANPIPTAISNTHFITLESSNSEELRIDNCVFDQDENDIYNEKHIIFSSASLVTQFNNCIFETGNNPSRFYANETPITVKYSLFSSSYEGTINADHVTCNVTDMGLDENYVPIWNTEEKSVCIDNGNPDTNGNGILWYDDIYDTDSDGSRLDFGAKSLTDDHLHKIHRLNSQEIKWISFPGLYKPANATYIPSEESSIWYVFDAFNDNNLLTPPPNEILTDIWCKTNDSYYIAYPGDVPVHYVNSQNGYIVRLNSVYEGEKILEYQGYRPGSIFNAGMFLPELNRYTEDLFIKRPENGVNCVFDAYAQRWVREIYLGYYMPQSLKPRDALAPIWNDIIGVYAEDWCMARIPQVGNTGYTDNWIEIDDDVSDGIAINPGEMVAVYYLGNDDAEFKWGGENPNPPYVQEYYRDMPTYFGYEEQPEYVPVFVTLNLTQFEDGYKPLEIAIFVREECKGAAVIKEEQVQLNAYILNDQTIELEDLQFRLYFPAKASDSIIDKYNVMNYAIGRYESRQIKVAECGRFLQVSLDVPIETPEVTSLLGNYPNPFNPETTIKYCVSQSGKAKLEIYNVRGQLVKSLFDGNVQAGAYAAIWNGKDDRGKLVSSGVYFYRLTTCGLSLTNKMVLLK